MTEQLREQVSAFVDGELSDAEAALLLHRLGSDEQLRGEAAKLITLSQRMRGETSVAGDGFAGKVIAAIHASADDQPLSADEPLPQPAGRSVPVWLQAIGGTGIAAAVAVLAINTLSDGNEVDTELPPLASIAETAPATTVAISNDEQPFEYVVPSTVSDSGLVSADPELAAYFLNHSNRGASLAPGSGRMRMLAGEPVPMQQLPLNEARPGASER